MRRFYLLWTFAVTLAALVVASILSFIEEKRLLNEERIQTTRLFDSVEDSLLANYDANHYSAITKLGDRLKRNHQIFGLAICDLKKEQAFSFPPDHPLTTICQTEVKRFIKSGKESFTWVASVLSHQKLEYYIRALKQPGTSPSSLYLVLTQDLSHLNDKWLESFTRIFVSTWAVGLALLALITTQIRKAFKANLRSLRQTLRSITAGRKPNQFPLLMDEPIARELETLAKKVIELRSSPKRGPLKGEQTWLEPLTREMAGQKLVVIANREPYIHQHKNGKIEIMRPASGLVTALEPILRQIGGLWIAHGSGSADLETVDSNHEVRVPPQNSTYSLRRVFLTPEEEQGYYYGFSNEGLWPLCHLAHNRPTFRLSDWNAYKSVNQKFANAVPVTSRRQTPLILVQDYHFALAPQLLRARPEFQKAKIATFWHIPWPNPEAFGICPWNVELLKGILGADIIGFHTQYHCNNFLETCDRYLECRIDWENFSVNIGNHETQIRAFPIGINPVPLRYISDSEKEDLKIRYGIQAEFVAVGVDRIDYTKGLVERIEAIERFLEKYPQYLGRFSYVQMGSPSRTHIPAYRDLNKQLEDTITRVNKRFGSESSGSAYQPIHFLHQHFEWDQIQYFYQLGDLCLVTSLHDGMNLVAKEYVWCQKPENGSLILSKFAGASRELSEAFIVNPYSTEELADAILSAIELTAAEKSRRMLIMKQKIESHNVFHWASDLIQALMRKGETVSVQKPLSDHQGKFRLEAGI